MIKVIFFDFDGVIVESVDIKTSAFAELFKNEGDAVQKQIVEYHSNNTGVSRYEKFRYFYNEILKRPLDNQEMELLCNKFENLVFKAITKAPYVEGAKEFLEKHSFNHNCYIISATPHKEIEKIVKKRTIDQYFKGIYGSPADKSEIVGKIIKKEKILPSEAVYIGDAMTDYIAAKSNNVNFIARINDNERLFSKLDCIKVDDLTGIKKILVTLDN